jgi:hypothetical protein
MSKQTAVIWFNQQLVERQNGNGDRRSWDEILREALVIEREQIIQAHGNKMRQDIENNIDVYFITTGQQYYNETYGGDK